VIGLAITVKPQTLAFAAVIVAWILLRSRPKAPAAISAAVFVLTGGLVLAPFLAEDVAAWGRPVLFAAGGREAFEGPIGIAWNSIGVNPYRDGWVNTLGAVLARPAEAWRIVTAYVPSGILEFFFGGWFGTFDPVVLDRFSEFAKELRLYGYLLAGIGIVGGIFSRARWAVGLTLAFVLLQAAAVVVLGYPQVRYRIPSDPILLAYVAFGIVVVSRIVSGAASGRRIGLTA
jgi:hypothetical protein